MSFEKEILLNGVWYKLQCSRIHSPQKEKVFIQVITRFSNIISFEMQCNEELEWKIIDPYPPQWAFVLEEQIGKMIGGR